MCVIYCIFCNICDMEIPTRPTGGSPEERGTERRRGREWKQRRSAEDDLEGREARACVDSKKIKKCQEVKKSKSTVQTLCVH